jgi:hypothetical protein
MGSRGSRPNDRAYGRELYSSRLGNDWSRRICPSSSGTARFDVSRKCGFAAVDTSGDGSDRMLYISGGVTVECVGRRIVSSGGHSDVCVWELVFCWYRKPTIVVVI